MELLDFNELSTGLSDGRFSKNVDLHASAIVICDLFKFATSGGCFLQTLAF